MKITLEVDVPDQAELARIVDAWFDAQPLSTAYAVFEGDEEGSRRDDPKDLDTEEQRRVISTATRYLWLAAARKRAERP